MTATTQLDFTAPPIVKTLGRWALIVGVVASVIAVITVFAFPNGRQEFFRAYLLSYMDWLGIALGSMAIIMIRHLTGGGWGVVIRRLQGAAMRTLPLLAALFIPIILGMQYLYPWAQDLEGANAQLLRIHAAYLYPKFFIFRAVFYFIIWNLISFLLSKWSKEGDSPAAPDNTQKFKAVAGPGLILYGGTISFAAIDWVMSLDPSWISTIFGLIILIGEVLAAMCFAVVIERILYNYKPMSEMLKPDFIHDHGKWMLTFIMVWAYFSFSQWLIIWAGNLPAEITFYLKRLNGGWGWIGLILVLFHFAIPFALLLSRPFKRDIHRLVWLAAWMLIMRYVDLFWIIEPNFSKTFTVTIADLVVPFAMGGLWLAFFFRNLGSLPLLPAYDPTAGEVLHPAHHHGGT